VTGLERLVGVTDPANQVTTYGYDSRGNLITRLLPNPGEGNPPEFLKGEGVASMVFYPLALHQQHAFPGSAKQHLPQAQSAAHEVLCLPIYPNLDLSVVEEVAGIIEAQGA